MYNYIQRQVVCVMGELVLLTTGNLVLECVLEKVTVNNFVTTVCNVDF